jgi:hypothetical protein
MNIPPEAWWLRLGRTSSAKDEAASRRTAHGRARGFGVCRGGSPVSLHYDDKAPFPFNGTIDWVRVAHI